MLLDRLDFYGNNGWGRNPQAEAILPSLLGDLASAGLSLVQAKEAMESIGYGKDGSTTRWDR